MPCLELSTNVPVSDREKLMRLLSECVCTGLGKAETYMMVMIHDETAMLFGGNTEPAAHVGLRATGLRPEAVQILARRLTDVVTDTLNIESQRVFVVFADADLSKWAWDGHTFA